jgi:GTP cyclohydrolase I
VLVREIDFASTSLTSLLPFHGRVHVAYVPSNGVVLGLSKLARLTKVFSKRLQTQERLGRDIASALSRYLACQGVAVLISAKQLLLSGAQQPQAVLTACTGGSFTSDPSQLEVGWP